jgi:hypothetical protein
MSIFAGVLAPVRRSRRGRFLFRGFLQFPGKFFNALAHYLAGLKFHRRPRRNNETAAGLIWVSTDPGLGQAWLKDAEITKLDRHVARQAVGDFIKRALNDIENLVLHHACLIANRDHDVPFSKFCHIPRNESFLVAKLEAKLNKKRNFFAGLTCSEQAAPPAARGDY